MWWIALNRKRQHPQQELFSFRLCFGPVLCNSPNVYLVVSFLTFLGMKYVEMNTCGVICFVHLWQTSPVTTILKWFECSFCIFIIEYVGWDGRTLPFFYERTRQGAWRPATRHFATQGLIQNPQKSTDVYSLISVDLNTFLSLRLALLRVAWPSNIFGGLRRNIL